MGGDKVDQMKLHKCIETLKEVASKNEKITYEELELHTGISKQSPRKYLDAIWRLTAQARLPDLTVVVVRKGKDYGSRLPASDKVFDPNDPEHRRIYDRELDRVYATDWSDFGPDSSPPTHS